jgi:glutamyl/glutaminyl-tRNA synthetase
MVPGLDPLCIALFVSYVKYPRLMGKAVYYPRIILLESSQFLFRTLGLNHFMNFLFPKEDALARLERSLAKKEGYSTELRDPCRDKGLTSGAIKLRTPDDEIVTYYDFVFKKEISWNTSGVRDAVLLKSDGIFPTYHLAVAVDDHEMGVSHIFRGYDWLPSTPIHLLVFKYLGYELPALGHLTDIQDPEGGKLSKRKGSTSCQGLLDDGYLPEALLNFIALCGWAPKDNREMFLLSDFVDAFTLDGIQKANPVFNRDKLNWFNREYIKKLSDDEKKEWVLKFLPEPLKNLSDEMLNKLIPILVERIDYFEQITELAQQDEYDYFISQPIIDLEKLVWKTDTLDQAKTHLQQIITLLQDYDGVWTSDTIKSTLWDYAESVGRGSVLWPMRFALSGREKSPDPFTLAEIFGKTETLERIDNVIKKL